MRKNYWLPLYPDIKSPIGGVKQIHRLSEILMNLGQESCIIQEDENFHPGWFSSNVKTISLDRFKEDIILRKNDDVLILPETFIEELSTLAPGIPKIIFNQNASYSFGFGEQRRNPKSILSLYNHADIKHFLCVSKHDEELLCDGFALGQGKVSRIANAIEIDIFHPSSHKHRIISFMPRKNPIDAEIVTTLLTRQPWFQQDGWRLIPIHQKTHEEVSNVLQKSLIFLSFGHPEGFGLPLAEAASCGCFLIGYSGLGGKEIFSICADQRSGIEIDFGNWHGFNKACAQFNEVLNANPQPLINALFKTSEIIRTQYSTAKMKESVLRALLKWQAML